jgi:hypothetical protein
MVQLFSDQLRGARADGRPAGVAATWLRTLGDLAVTAASEHARRDRTVAHSLTVPPSTSSRLLGLIGIVGGAFLLAAFVVDIAPDVNVFRGIMFPVGAMAIVLAVHRRQSSTAPTLAFAGAAPAFVANVWTLGMMLLTIGNPHPFAGVLGWMGFWGAVAMWLGDAWFGLVTLRLGVATRWGALALAIGSLFAVAGLDRFELTSTIFGPLALAGIALNGIGWILLGVDVALRRRAPKVLPRGEA